MRCRTKPLICFLVELCCFHVQCLEESKFWLETKGASYGCVSSRWLRPWLISVFLCFVVFCACTRLLCMSTISVLEEWVTWKHGLCRTVPEWSKWWLRLPLMEENKPFSNGMDKLLPGKVDKKACIYALRWWKKKTVFVPKEVEAE